MRSLPAEREVLIANLIEQTRGNPEAFGDIYEAFRTQVLSEIRLHNIRGPDADDVAQNTFTKAFEYLPRFKGKTGTSLSGWFHSLTTSAVSDHFRRINRRFKNPINVVSLEGDHSQEDSRPTFELIPNSSRPLEEQVFINERIERVGENIKVLPPLTQRVLVLSGWGYSGQEAAEICGVSLCEVKRRKHRGRARLKKLEQLR